MYVAKITRLYSIEVDTVLKVPCIEMGAVRAGTLNVKFYGRMRGLALAGRVP